MNILKIYRLELRPGQTGSVYKKKFQFSNSLRFYLEILLGTDSKYGFALPVDRYIYLNILIIRQKLLISNLILIRAPLVGEETFQGVKAFLAAVKAQF